MLSRVFLLSLFIAAAVRADDLVEFRLARSKVVKNSQKANLVEMSIGSEELLVDHDAVLTSADIRSAELRMLQPPPRELVDTLLEGGAIAVETGEQVLLLLTLTEGGAKRLARVTSEHEHERMAILYRGALVSAPVIAQPVTGGQLQISASQADEQMFRRMANDLNDRSRAMNPPPTPAVRSFP